MSFYLKYRPYSFDTLVGQKHIVDVLKAQIGWNKLNHNYLFYGPRGTWKTSTARLLAKAVNDENFLQDQSSEIVQLIDTGKTLDYVEIDAASHTWVDNIREEIIEKALYRPTSLKKKVYVIDEVHMLSKGAFNALLKIMEEPPEYLMFILATTEIHKVPDTIISRCQVFNFTHHSVDDIVAYLSHIADQESIEYEKEGLTMIARMAQWWLRDAIKYLEQVSILGKVTEAQVASSLWVVSQQVLEGIVNFCKEKDFEKVITQMSTEANSGTNLPNLFKDLLWYADEHFLEDPDFYSTFIEFAAKTIREMKGSTYPLAIIKAQAYNYLTQKRGWTSEKTDNAQQNVNSSQEKREAKKVEVKEKKAEIVSEAESTKEQPVPKEDNTDTKENTQERTKENTWETDSEKIKEQLIEKVDKRMMKTILKSYAMIEKIEDNTVYFIIMQQQFYSSFSKAENLTYMASFLKEIMGKDVTVVAKFMSKEDVFKKQLLA